MIDTKQTGSNVRHALVFLFEGGAIATRRDASGTLTATASVTWADGLRRDYYAAPDDYSGTAKEYAISLGREICLGKYLGNCWGR